MASRKIILPADQIIPITSGAGEEIYTKKVSDIGKGDYLYSFQIDSISPKLLGHFKFVKVIQKLKNKSIPALEFSIFHKKEGPKVLIPKDWRFIVENSLPLTTAKKSIPCFNFPGYTYDEIPSAFGFRLFYDCVLNDIVDENLAYFLGALCVRPETYFSDPYTYGVFGNYINIAAKSGYDNSTLKSNLQDHLNKVSYLASKVWGNNYYIELKGKNIGLKNRKVPKGLNPGSILNAHQTYAGFAIHAPISKQHKLNIKKIDDKDLIKLQYWYSFLSSRITEHSPPSVQKSFLLGAFENSNQDKLNKTAGIDYRDNWSGDFPLYNIVFSISKRLFESCDQNVTSYIRTTSEKRQRGELFRLDLYEYLEKIGFLGHFRFNRSIEYEPEAQGRKVDMFPYNNMLSVILNQSVSSISHANKFGSIEDDLSFQTISQIGAKKKLNIVEVILEEDNAFPLSSFPLGYYSKDKPITKFEKNDYRRLSKNNWRDEAIECIHSIDKYIDLENIKKDMVFEYLIACTISKFEYCKETWFIPRHQDQGIDVGARFNIDETIRPITVLFQAKLHAKKISRRTIDQLRGALGSTTRDKGDIGYVVSISGFTQPAIDSANSDMPRIELINGIQLVDLMKKHSVGIIEKKNKLFLDITFFNQLKILINKTYKSSEKVFISMDENNTPIQIN